MIQIAPEPEVLHSLVERLKYRPGWHVDLVDTDRGQGSIGLTLRIFAKVADSYHPDSTINVAHYMIVPAAAYDEIAWRRWLLDQILLVERHEACEYFQIDGHRPFAPNHGPGRDPYQIMELGTIEDAETSFRGERKRD